MGAIFSDLSRSLAQTEPSFSDWANPAAVMVMIALDPEPSVLLIQRPDTLSRHPGQIACPGGSYDSLYDRTLWDAAVRESREEVGISIPEVAFQGFLDPVHIPVTGYTLLPAVAILAGRPRVVPAPMEVASYHWVSLAELAACRTMSRVVIGDATYAMPEFPLSWGRLWGATARFIDQLLQCLHHREEG